MREPLPKEFVIEAWKARVGYSADSVLTHVAYHVDCQHQSGFPFSD
jgi:hypothetical protein